MTSSWPVGLLLACALCISAPARAQTAEELSRARALFGEALKDEQARSYTVALEKFERVRKVRDNAAVRYRIAACLESLGRLREARDLYATVVGEGAKPTAEDAEIQAAGRTKAQDLEKRIPTLAVRTADGAAATLTIDGRAAQLGEAVPVDPGEHRVVLTRPAVQAAESRANVIEGAHVALSIPLAATATVDPPPQPAKPASSGGSSQKWVGGAVAASGLALGISSLVLLFVRESTISNIDSACPGGACPRLRQGEVEGWRSRASTLGPVAAVLGGAGVVAAGVGVTLFVTAPSSSNPPQAFVSWEGRF